MKLLYNFLFLIAISASAAKTRNGILLPCSIKINKAQTHTVLTSEEKESEKRYNQDASNLKQRLINAKKAYKSQKNISKSVAINIIKSVFVIKDKFSTGSGFFTSLWGIPVGITNAHVIATMQKPSIMDGRGISYEIKSMLALTDRDIVIFELKNPDGLRPIPMLHQVHTVPINSTIYAYGNSQGHGVITKLSGRIQGIGPAKIEITAGIVPGNSGGPVIYKNNVIGVSTLMTRSAAYDWRLEGTRFAQKTNIWGTKVQSGIRRFGTRIDSISLNKVKILNPITGSRDIEIIQELQAANNAATQSLVDKMKTLKNVKNLSIENYQKRLFNNKDLEKMLEDCYEKMRLNPDSCSSSNKLLETALRKQLSIYRAYSYLWNFQELFASKNPYFKTNFVGIIKNLKRYYQKPQKCRLCKGKGFIVIERDVNDNTVSKKMISKYSTYNQKCQNCNGTGSLKRSPYYYKLKNPKYADKIYTPSKIKFLGFRPGATNVASHRERRKMIFSHRFRENINNTYFYTKNPRFPLSSITKLNFVLGKLQEIKIYFPDSIGRYQQMKNRLEDKYGKTTWESSGYFAFSQIDKPTYSIMLARVPDKDKYAIVVTCKHRKLSNAKYLFNKLRRKTSRIKGFKVKLKGSANTGF